MTTEVPVKNFGCPMKCQEMNVSDNLNAPLVTLQDLMAAREVVKASKHFVRTPTLQHVQSMFGLSDIDLHFKMENMQTTGSFKVRGVINQLATLQDGCGTKERRLITVSAGNYGKAFGFVASHHGLHGLVLLPTTAPQNRTQIIEGFGMQTERFPTSELWPRMRDYIKTKNMVELHSFDDTRLIAGYGSCGFEILEDAGVPDVVLVCCGGGGFVSGVAAAIKLSGKAPDCRVYAVEPQGSRTMYESFRAGHAVSMEVSSVAAGLSPPTAGLNTFRHCKEFVQDVLLVSDDEILSATFALYNRGLVVEPSGAAAFAALYHGKVPNVIGKKVVVVLTGGNVTPSELEHLSQTKPSSSNHSRYQVQ